MGSNLHAIRPVVYSERVSEHCSIANTTVSMAE